MVAKWRQGTYWLFRIHRATGGRFLVVHYANSWTCVDLSPLLNEVRREA